MQNIWYAAPVKVFFGSLPPKKGLWPIGWETLVYIKLVHGHVYEGFSQLG